MILTENYTTTPTLVWCMTRGITQVRDSVLGPCPPDGLRQPNKGTKSHLIMTSRFSLHRVFVPAVVTTQVLVVTGVIGVYSDVPY